MESALSDVIDRAIPPRESVPASVNPKDLRTDGADGKLICHAEITRTGESWQAGFRSGVNVVGRAGGTLGARTSSQLVEAALVAMVRQAAAQGG